jgi:hypothetical protein
VSDRCISKPFGDFHFDLDLIRTKGWIMRKTEFSTVGRRDFIATSSFWALGTSLVGGDFCAQESATKEPELLEELTAEELELVEGSVMAKDLNNYFEKGYSCAESGLMVALRHLEKPEELVWVAGGFGGGLGRRDLCGFLAAGVMAIGLAAGDLPLDRKEAKQKCRRMVKDYWQTWISMSPLHCWEIREGRTGFKVCRRLGMLASARLETLF